ncbi:hypothetical protein PybrP1_012709 [[Pythium] brassicae (nom. inval.)]|nr:hypothetical protein PybrP1_012709 [[Pythium] brassicae (nom. inval.)]
MPLLKEIQANAAVAWSPVKRRAELLALGAKGDGGVGFEHSGGEFKLVSMDLSNPSADMLPLGSVKTPARFTSLAWRDIARHHDALPLGLVAGGMADGAVSLWNPKALIDGGDSSPEIGRITRHKGAVNALQFNPHEDSAHLLASGGSDGEVYIMSLEKLSSPGVFTPGGPAAPQQQINEITSVAWNTQVNYILATGSQNGSVVIWDLKQKKPWCELRDPQRGMISAIAWNPNEGLQIATASGDDQRPVVKLWDLRNSTSTPLAEFHEHSAGVLSLSWCPDDPGLLLSCAKDNKTLLWDLFSRKSLYEFPSASESGGAPSMGSDQFFGGGAGQRRWNVQWSPSIPAVASACTLDGKVQVWGLSGGGSPACRPPKWTRRPAGASFGFGGKLVTIANPTEPAGPNADRRRLVHVHRIVSESRLVAEAEELDRSLESRDFSGHCERKIAGAANATERSVWSFMKILFEQDARQHLLQHLGLDAEKINALNAKFNPQAEVAATPQLDPTAALLNQRIDGIGAEDMFSSEYHANNSDALVASPLADVSALAAALPAADDTSKRLEGVHAPIYTEQSESMLMQALLVGNFEVAVNMCLHYNQFADALLLASCGGPELWEKTQRAFFAQQTRPVMRVVSAIIKSELFSLVEQSDLKEWSETLAILSTYAKSEEFPSLCDKLATRLEEAGDLHSATLCFMCAVNVEKTVNAWVKESEFESRVFGHTLALQRLVEKVSIFSQAIEQQDQSMGDAVAMRFAEYASLMAAEGRLDIAAKYARFPDLSCAILKDRIFHAAPIPGYQPPPFPFEVVQVHTHVPQQQQHHHQAAQHQQHQQVQQVQQPQAQGYGAQAQGYGTQFGAQAPAPVAVGGYGGVQTPSYQQQPRAPSPAYTGRQPQPGYGQPQPPQQPAATYAAPQQPTYAAPQQASYGQTPYPGQTAPPVQGGYPGQPQQAGYAGVPQPAAGYPGQQQQQQPGAFNRPQQPGFSGPPSTGAPNLAGYGAPQQMPQPSVFNPNAAAMASTGVNSLVAASSMASSRISKPSVDMSAQRQDGFVSSVGNRKLATKYGNDSTAVPSPVGAGPAKTFSPDMVTGSTENVSAQDLPIVTMFNDLFAQLQTLPLTMMEQKQMPEIQKAKDVMFTKLNIGDLSPNVVAQLHQIVACFAQRDFASAQGVYVALTASDWTQHKDWLRGLKSLIHISMKRFR